MSIIHNQSELFSPRIEVVAEAGVNHNGNLNIAMQMVEAAAHAGADIVKFQTYVPDRLLHRGDPTYNTLAALALKQKDFIKLSRYCEINNIEFMSTPGDIDSLHFLVDEVGVARIKIGSDDLTYAPLVEAALATGLSVIMSTGMATMDEIKEATKLFASEQLTLLHCVSLYPCPIQHANLRAMEDLRKLGFQVGYSDHVDGSLACVAAAAMGACMVEKHFMLTTHMELAIDKYVSIDESALEAMIEDIREIEHMLGTAEKKPTKLELANVAQLRKDSDGKRVIFS